MRHSLIWPLATAPRDTYITKANIQYKSICQLKGILKGKRATNMPTIASDVQIAHLTIITSKNFTLEDSTMSLYGTRQLQLLECLSYWNT